MLSTEELERGLVKGNFDVHQQSKVKRILGRRYSELDQNLQSWILFVAILAAAAGMLHFIYDLNGVGRRFWTSPIRLLYNWLHAKRDCSPWYT